MTAVALIVEHETPDLLALCLASLKRFAPGIRAVVVAGEEGADAHATAIERARASGLHEDAEIVVLLDTDVVILSEEWLPWIGATLEEVDVVGGLRHRGDVTQLFCEGLLLLHAHCLAMTRNLFEKTPTFAASGSWDTAWQVTMNAEPRGNTTAIIPQCCHQGWPQRVGLYWQPDPLMNGALLWAHLGRGTSFRARGPWRERARRLAACLGSPRARKILSYQQDRAEFLRKGWEIVNG